MLRIAGSILAGLLAIWGVASAGNVHFKGGGKAGPSFFDRGLTLNATGALAGLGNGDVLIILGAVGDPTGECCNPGGSCKVPGHNPAPVQVTGSQSIPASEVKNGNVGFNVTTQAPRTPVPGAPDCPNSGWRENITDMAFTSATLTVMQGGRTVLAVDCTFGGPTVDGRVSASCG